MAMPRHPHYERIKRMLLAGHLPRAIATELNTNAQRVYAIAHKMKKNGELEPSKIQETERKLAAEYEELIKETRELIFKVRDYLIEKQGMQAFLDMVITLQLQDEIRKLNNRVG